MTARLREMSDVPIILITGKSDEADKLRGFRLGVDDDVTKPFSFAELTARVQAVLARTRVKGNQERHLLIIGELVIDVDKRLARRGDEPIPLTPTEYRLLEFLANNQGHAISETELVQQIWCSFRGEDSTTVRRYIWLLRQKLEDDPANPRLILTVRGYVYRLRGGTGTLREPGH